MPPPSPPLPPLLLPPPPPLPPLPPLLLPLPPPLPLPPSSPVPASAPAVAPPELLEQDEQAARPRTPNGMKVRRERQVLRGRVIPHASPPHALGQPPSGAGNVIVRIRLYGIAPLPWVPSATKSVLPSADTDRK